MHQVYPPDTSLFVMAPLKFNLLTFPLHLTTLNSPDDDILMGVHGGSLVVSDTEP